jgi:hypothetical protein
MEWNKKRVWIKKQSEFFVFVDELSFLFLMFCPNCKTDNQTFFLRALINLESTECCKTGVKVFGRFSSSTQLVGLNFFEEVTKS